MRGLCVGARLAAVLALGLGSGSAQAATQVVRMVNFRFEPRLLTNTVGDTVLWTNTTGTGHNTVSSNGLWASPLFLSPGTFSFRFDAPGVYGYFCSPHAAFGMTGIIYVNAGGNDPPTVNLTDPTNNAVFLAPASFTLRAAASDPGGAVTNVQFFQDQTLLGSDATNPFELVLNSLTARVYNFTARAFDNLGAVATSPPVAVGVIDLRFATNFSLAGSAVPVTLLVSTGRTYAVEVSTNLAVWTGLTNFAATSNRFQFSRPADRGREFFRARLLSTP